MMIRSGNPNLQLEQSSSGNLFLKRYGFLTLRRGFCMARTESRPPGNHFRKFLKLFRAVLNRDPLLIIRSDVFGSWSNQPIVSALLNDMSGPTSDS